MELCIGGETTTQDLLNELRTNALGEDLTYV